MFLLGTNDGVFRSTDFGKNWDETTFVPLNGIYPLEIRSLACDDSYLFASNGVDIFCSTNYGLNWTFADNQLPKSPYGAILIHSLSIKDSILYTGTDAGVYFSYNHGMNWMMLNNGLDASSIMQIVSIKKNIYG